MLIQYISSVKIHRITLNYCLTETLPLWYKLYSSELDRQHLDNPVCEKISTYKYY